MSHDDQITQFRRKADADEAAMLLLAIAGLQRSEGLKAHITSPLLLRPSGNSHHCVGLMFT